MAIKETLTFFTFDSGAKRDLAKHKRRDDGEHNEDQTDDCTTRVESLLVVVGFHIRCFATFGQRMSECSRLSQCRRHCNWQGAFRQN
jgi:hypothetical protein